MNFKTILRWVKRVGTLSLEALPGVPMIGDAVAGPGKKLVEDNDVSTSIIPTPSKNLTHRFFSIASN